MKRSKLILILGVLLVVLLSGFYLLLRNRLGEEEATLAPGSEQAEQVQQDQQQMRATLENILRRGENSICEFSTTDDEGIATSGRLYVTDGGSRIRGEFDTVLSDGESYRSNLIRNGTLAYFWTSLSDQGFRMTLDENEESLLEPLQGTDDSGAWMNEEYEMDFDCKSWNVDNSVFNLPPDVNFVDMTSTLQQFNDASNDISDKCEACQLVPDDNAKAQCLAALNCN